MRNKRWTKMWPLNCLSQAWDSPTGNEIVPQSLTPHCTKGTALLWLYLCSLSSQQLKKTNTSFSVPRLSINSSPLSTSRLGFILMSSHKWKRNILRAWLWSQEKDTLKMEWLSLPSSLIPDPWPHKHQPVFDSHVISAAHHNEIKTAQTCAKKTVLDLLSLPRDQFWVG